MSIGKHAKKERLSVGNILYWLVGILLAFTMLTTCWTSGLFAKYVVSDDIYDSAHVAGTGIEIFELLEHKANETYTNSGEYELNPGVEVHGNEYEKVLPGVDIPKDPFIRMKLKNAKVSYELYLEVKEKDLPDTVTYELANKWKLIRTEADGTKLYQYVDATTKEPFIFAAGTDYSYTAGNEIQILKDNKLVYVSEHYEGKNTPFSLAFNAYLKQVKTN